MTTTQWVPEAPEAVAASDPNLFNFEEATDPRNDWGTDYLTGGCHAVVSLPTAAGDVTVTVSTAEDWELARSH